jgi:NitT/TauT family transport system substrate-binding protein
MKKKICSMLMALMLIISSLIAVGCSNDSKQTNQQTKKEKIKIAALKGPTGMGLVKLMEENKDTYDISLFDSPDQLVSKIVTGEIDGAAVPSNLAPILYNKTNGGVQLLGINTLGILYVVENGTSIKDIKDLKGKTIYSSGKGSTPEFVLNYILKKNGLEPDKDVKIEYKMQHSDLAAAVVSKEVKIAVLPEPFVTTAKMKDADLQIPIDLTKEYEKVSGTNSKLVMGTIVFRKDFLDKRAKDVDEFLTKYKNSVDFVNNNKAEAAKLIEKNGILPNAKLAEMAIPKCNIVFISAKDGQESLNKFYNILKENDPKSIGGKLPDENFYYKGN